MGTLVWTISILLLLLVSPRVAFFFTFVTGLVLETISPYSTGTYFAAVLMAFLALRIFVRNVVSHRTLWGALITAAVGAILLQILLLALAWLASRISAGWVPTLHQQYWSFLFWRVAITTLLVGITMLITKQLSPKIRGVLIEPR